MHRYIIAVFLSFLVLPVMSAAASQPHGHHSVTLPKNCSAIMDQDNESAPALHYMTHAYKRCMDLSRKMIRQQKTAPDDENAQDINKDDVLYNQNNSPKNYYRVTPRIKDENDE